MRPVYTKKSNTLSIDVLAPGVPRLSLPRRLWEWVTSSTFRESPYPPRNPLFALVVTSVRGLVLLQDSLALRHRRSFSDPFPTNGTIPFSQQRSKANGQQGSCCARFEITFAQLLLAQALGGLEGPPKWRVVRRVVCKNMKRRPRGGISALVI